MTDVSPITVLVVDDSRADAQLTQLWLRNSPVVRDVRVVRSGREAIEYLRRQGPFAQAPPAQLVLLDVNLPDMLGWDLLAELRRDDELARIPVIVLTGTILPSDSKLAKQFNVARYLCKPFDADEFAALVSELEAVAREGQEGP